MTNELPQEPELLRREISATRTDMDRTLAEIEDRVSPTRIKERQTAKVRSRWADVKTSVMGSADEAQEHGAALADQAQSNLQDAQQAVRQTPQQLEDATRGNPLAAGLIAFGVGALAGSLLPASSPERKVASELRDQFEEPVKEQLQRSGDEVRTELQEHAQDAIEDTKQTAQQAAERVKAEAEDSVEQVQGRAQDATETVRSQS
jgi:gas vesicle protein